MAENNQMPICGCDSDSSQEPVFSFAGKPLNLLIGRKTLLDSPTNLLALGNIQCHNLTKKSRIRRQSRLINLIILISYINFA